VLAPDERFAFILADPPWVRSSDVARYPQDPVAAIDGGHDGLDLARTCADLIGHHLAHRGAAILQLGDADQVTSMRSYLDSTTSRHRTTSAPRASTTWTEAAVAWCDW